MVGENYSSGEIYELRQKGEAVLKLENLSGEGFCDVSFEVKRRDYRADGDCRERAAVNFFSACSVQHLHMAEICM